MKFFTFLDRKVHVYVNIECFLIFPKKKFGKIVKDASKKVKKNYENLCFQLEKRL